METYLNTKELGEYLHIAEQTIRRWVMNDEIPYHRIHNVIRYRISEIEKWIDDGGYLMPEEEKTGLSDGFPPDVISLDELAEMEQADEMPEDDEE